MGLRVNNNIAALNSYNNLQKTDKAVQSSLQKLSSGYRINKAADDAAGLVVSEGLRSQISGLTVAARNAQDGVNVAQTADGALGTTTTILQRMRDLSVQMANDTNSTDSRAAGQLEVGQLQQELDRIASSTKFNGTSLLNGLYNATFQVGAGNVAADDQITAGFTSTGASLANAKFTGGVAAGTASITLTQGTTVTTVTSLTTADTDTAVIAGKLNSDTNFAAGGYKATVDTTGKLVIESKNNATDLVVAGLGTVLSHGAAGAGAGGFSASALGVAIGGVDISTKTGAQSAITALDAALTKVSAARASIGALQNRFENAIANINTTVENLTASESSIRDTDMAAEMTKFTKNQVLSQAGTSMLAQANSSTQNILTLLRG